MKDLLAISLLPALLLAGCASGTQGSMAATPPIMETGPAMAADVVPAGTTLLVQLDEPIGRGTAAMALRKFTATVLEPVQSASGQVLIPQNAKLEGTVTAHLPGRGRHPELVGLEFDRLRIGSASYDIDGEIIQVDLALADDASSSAFALRAPVISPTARIAGTIMEDPELFFQEHELGFEPGTVISLGMGGGETLPAGARMRVELGKDLPVMVAR